MHGQRCMKHACVGSLRRQAFMCSCAAKLFGDARALSMPARRLTYKHMWRSGQQHMNMPALIAASVCSLFNNILTPADLDDRASIFFFLEGIKPDWEDPQASDGGIWQVPVKQKGQAGKSQLEIYWADVVRSEPSKAQFSVVRGHSARNLLQALTMRS